MSAYYNEIDPKACAWLRELIKAGIIPDGRIDERSVVDVTADDLNGFDQCHFFAGIGGWAYALQLADWPRDRPVWTASLPCQPFSSAGKRQGEKDPRHLWPIFRSLVAECNPSSLFGEQVASKDSLLWLNGVRTDLEASGYAVGASDLCSAGVGSPNIRQRIYWAADMCRQGLEIGSEQPARKEQSPVERGGDVGGLEYAQSDGWQQRRTEPIGRGFVGGCGSGGTGHSPLSEETRFGQLKEQLHGSAAWSAFDIIPCADGKSRRIESGTFPLVAGLPGRVGLLRGYGNAINPVLAAEFIGAYLDCEREG